MARILVVDDDDNVRAMVRIILEREGHQIEEASNGLEGLARAMDTIPDLLVTNGAMPVMTGDELIDRLHSNPTTQHIPIVGITGHQLQDRRADVVLRKPFAPNLLSTTVAHLLARRKPQ